MAATREYWSFKTAERKAAKRHRTPEWADLNSVKKVYEECPDGMTVDHVLPLQGETVSGLHIAENLQYLTLSDNSRKSNRFRPYIERNGQIAEYL